MARLFLSHNWQDKPFVRSLAFRLREAGHYVWIDEAEISVGDSLIRKISGALQDSDYVVAVISRTSVQSNWVRKELELAMYREISGMTVHVLPVLIHRCDTPYFLRDKLYADFTNKSQFEFSLRQLLAAIERHSTGKNLARDILAIRDPVSVWEQKCERESSNGPDLVGSTVTMKDVADLRIAKSMHHQIYGALFYVVIGLVGLFMLFTAPAIPKKLACLGAAVVLAAFTAAGCEFFEAGMAYLLLQHDKRFIYDVEHLQGHLLPLGRNWRSLFRSSWPDSGRVLYLIASPMYYLLPIVVFIVIYTKFYTKW